MGRKIPKDKGEKKKERERSKRRSSRDHHRWSPLSLSHLEKKPSQNLPPLLRLLACDDPLMPEIFDCIAQPWGLQLPAEGQQGSHPADYVFRGRIRVALKGADGLPLNPEVPDRQALFLKVAELLARHPNRSPEAVAQRKAEEAAARAAAMKAAARAQGGGVGGDGESGGSGGGGGASSSSKQRSASKKKGRK